MNANLLLDAINFFIKTFWFIWLGLAFSFILYHYEKRKQNKKLMKIASWIFICFLTIFILINIYLWFTPSCC